MMDGKRKDGFTSQFSAIHHVVKHFVDDDGGRFIPGANQFEFVEVGVCTRPSIPINRLMAGQDGGRMRARGGWGG